MKRIILLLLAVMLLAGTGWAWMEPGQTALDPITAQYYRTLYASTLLPLVPGTGSIGVSGNAFDAAYIDTANCTKFVSSTLDTGLAIRSSGTGISKNNYIHIFAGDEPGIFASDSNTTVARMTSSWTLSRTYGGWYSPLAGYFGGLVTGGGGLAAGGGKVSGGYLEVIQYIQSKNNATTIAKNNEITMRTDVDNPYIASSDSSSGNARTRDSLVYIGTAGFLLTKPLNDSAIVLLAYPQGLRPATPVLGMMIAIDGTTTTDSLLIYLGGAWVVLKP